MPEEEFTTKRSKRMQLQYKSTVIEKEVTKMPDEPLIDLDEGETRFTKLKDQATEFTNEKAIPYLRNDLPKWVKQKAPKHLKDDVPKWLKNELPGHVKNVPKYLKEAPRKAVIAGGVLSFALLLTFGLILSYDGGDGSDVLSEQTGSLEFETITPSDVGGEVTTTQVDEELGLFIYQQELDGVEITVTQQEKPEDLANDVFGLQKLANSLEAKTSISQLESDQGPFYVALNDDQSQTVLATTDTSLFFITSPKPIASNTWISYVNSIQ